MDADAETMIGLTPKFMHSHSLNAKEHVSIKDGKPSRQSGGSILGKKDDKTRQERVERLPGSGGGFFDALGHHRGRLHAASAQLDCYR
jgi:hypothetical protein